ncbi:unnamed protein product [Amoebophrya sp. A25]|nr:unnamed protein product [Amoebophrya sp. A25]|eukprot:GSA25T00025791001.1
MTTTSQILPPLQSIFATESDTTKATRTTITTTSNEEQHQEVPVQLEPSMKSTKFEVDECVCEQQNRGTGSECRAPTEVVKPLSSVDETSLRGLGAKRPSTRIINTDVTSVTRLFNTSTTSPNKAKPAPSTSSTTSITKAPATARSKTRRLPQGLRLVPKLTRPGCPPWANTRVFNKGSSTNEEPTNTTPPTNNISAGDVEEDDRKNVLSRTTLEQCLIVHIATTMRWSPGMLGMIFYTDGGSAEEQENSDGASNISKVEHEEKNSASSLPRGGEASSLLPERNTSFLNNATAPSDFDPIYLAPELARYPHERPTRAADSWSLGMLLFELLTGRRPFASFNVLPSFLHRLAYDTDRLVETEILRTICSTLRFYVEKRLGIDTQDATFLRDASDNVDGEGVRRLFEDGNGVEKEIEQLEAIAGFFFDENWTSGLDARSRVGLRVGCLEVPKLLRNRSTMKDVHEKLQTLHDAGGAAACSY